MTYWRTCRNAVLLLAAAVGCSSQPASERASAVAMPNGPCIVSGNPDWREAAQNWCDGQIFSRVNVAQDASNVVVILQFTAAGQTGFSGNKFGTLNKFRLLADEMATKTDMNVAFSLHDPGGQFIGGCVRSRSARESDCNAK